MEGLPSVIPKSIVEVQNRLENDEDNLFSWKLMRSQDKPIWSPYCKAQIQQVEKVQRTAARWTAGGGATLVVLARCSMSCNGQLSRPRRINPLSFSSTKIHCGIKSIDKDKYLTPSQRTRSTRSSHNSQYCRPQTYSDALKYSFFQGLFSIGIVLLQLWSQLRPQRSLWHSFK